uniref:Methyltransferase type 11 domain-containing protein n=1 Tax=Ananas comosus var. bracteatus TaxID=296719 RepID=A0A6V7Q7J2_ANACO|nr:unnamed protein product [Ananas comosus var. bracteatus]
MPVDNYTKPPLLKPLLLLLPLSFVLLLLLVHRSDPSSPQPGSFASSSSSSSHGSPLIRMRRTFRSYDEYLKLQLNKTLDPRLRRVWATRDWERKVDAFARFFARHAALGLLSNASRALCVGARLGQEVAALRRIGVAAALGIDLAPAPPLVAEGDFHAQPFADASFDFEFSNVFDHALYPDRFAAEIQRTLRPAASPCSTSPSTAAATSTPPTTSSASTASSPSSTAPTSSASPRSTHLASTPSSSSGRT